MTPEELKAKIYPKLLKKYIQTAAWSDVTAAFGAATQGDKEEVVLAVRRQDISRIGRVVGRVVLNHLQDQADTEATAMSLDIGLDQAELERLYD